MSTENYIAIDLGATSGRVILAGVEDGKITMETVHRFPTPLIQLGKNFHWDIYSLYDNIIKGLTAVGQKKIEIKSIGIDTWGVDFVCINRKGGLLGLPHSYRDPYTGGIPEKFFKKMPAEELYNRTGIQIMNFNSVFQLYAQHEAGEYELDKARKILFMPDALSYMLTGKAVCEYTILSTSALMDPRTKKLDKKILSVCHVKPRRFPSIVFPGEKIGKLTPEIAERTGLGRVPVVAVAGHDTGSAVAAVPASDEKFAYLSSGTWSLMGIETKAPVIDRRMYGLNFTNEGGIGGTTRLLKNITGMWLLEQCLVKWRSEGKDYSYEEIAQMASEAPASKRLIDVDDPSFASPTDMPAAIEAWCRGRGMEAPESDAAMMRLIYDSLAGKYAQVFNDLKQIAPFEINALHIIGGGSRNELLNQMTADACSVKVIAGPAEGTALGNVMVQAGIRRADLYKSIDIKVYTPKK